MTLTTLLLCMLLATFGLLCALVAWFILRVAEGAFWAFVAFNAILVATSWGIVQIISA